MWLLFRFFFKLFSGRAFPVLVLLIIVGLLSFPATTAGFTSEDLSAIPMPREPLGELIWELILTRLTGLILI